MKKTDVKVGQTLVYRSGPVATKVKVLALDQERWYWGGDGRRQHRRDTNGVLVQPLLRIVFYRSRHEYIKTCSDATEYEPFVVHFRSLADDWAAIRHRNGDRLSMYETRFRRERVRKAKQDQARAELVPLLKKAGVRNPLVSHSTVSLTLEQTRKLLMKAGVK